MSVYVAQQAGYVARYSFSSIIGRSPELEYPLKLARSAAESNITTLLYGESGTGKELFAQAIHNASARSGQPFVAVNCGAIPRSLLQSELFGYAEGSFTGAARHGHPGKFELADGGTIFLDEISELPLEAQTALLRLIQTKEVERIARRSCEESTYGSLRPPTRIWRRLSCAEAFARTCCTESTRLPLSFRRFAPEEETFLFWWTCFCGKFQRRTHSSLFSFGHEEALRVDVARKCARAGNVIECAVAICNEQEISLEQLDFIMTKGALKKEVSPERLPVIGENGRVETLSDMEQASLRRALAQTGGNVKKLPSFWGVPESRYTTRQASII